METDQYMTPEEVSVKLRVTVDTVWRWCRAGLGRRIGNQYRITNADIDAFFPKDTAHGLEHVATKASA